MSIYDVWLRAKKSLSTVFKSKKKPTVNATQNQPNSINTLLAVVNSSPKVIVHVKTKDLKSATTNFNRFCSPFESKEQRGTNLPSEEGMEIVTDELHFERGNWGHTVTVDEIFNLLHNQFVKSMEVAQ